ncbi:tetratricopeptide repeat protein [Emcibacter sp. SYSU 3D8]|uniref:tetratricopeptide repeat protein n=1 Tax=Emcibacter sp. SYSU 3D8 TaxID=3133969 RepID=UPI0031FEF36C
MAAGFAALLLACSAAFAAAPAHHTDDPARPQCGPAGIGCEQAPAGDPEDGVREWMAVSTAFQAYDYAMTLKAIDALAARQPFNGDVAFMRGYALMRQHKDAEAIAAFDRALSLDPQNTVALAHRGLVRAGMGDTAQGLADLDAALAIVGENPAALAYKGLILLRAGKESEGLTLLDNAAAAAPDFVWLRLVKATALAELGRLDVALADADKALEAAPDDPSPYGVRARIRLDRRDPAGAMADVDKALSLGGQDPFLLVMRGRAKMASGDAEGAIADLALLNREYPGADPAMKPELPSLFGDGPGDPLPRLMLAVMKIEKGDPKGARAIAEQVLMTTPWARPAVLMVRAYASQTLGDYPLALADLDELESSLGKTAESQYIRAKVLWGSGQRDSALATIDSAIGLSPDDDMLLKTRATFRYESGDLAGALPDFVSLRASEEYGDWAWQMQFLTLHFVDRNAEAGEQALAYLRSGKPVDDELLRTVANLIWQLQAGDTWLLADDLLAVAAVPSQGEDFDLFLRARSLAHAGNTAEAEALLPRIGAHDVLFTASSDAVYAPLWDAPVLRAALADPAVYRRSFEAAWNHHRRQPENLFAAIYAMSVLAQMGCGEPAADAARRLIPSLPRYAAQAQFGVPVFETIASEALQRGDAEAALAAWDDGIARLGADNPYALSLVLNGAFLMLGNGAWDEALARVARVEAISPSYDYAIVMAHYVRAMAYDALDRPRERDASIDYAAAHAADNPIAAVLGVGMLRGPDAAARLVESLQEPSAARLLLDSLHIRPQPPATSDIERREQALLDRLRADPRVIAALKPAGRILTLPESKTCPLSSQELAEWPFQYPFENGAVTGEARSSNEP